MTTTIENVTSGSGNDSLTGNVLDNILDGGAGNDTLIGGYGDDELIGGFGDDTLTGGFGDDTLTGGSGNDTFVFGEIFGDDTITDFDGTSDMIDLSAITGMNISAGSEGSDVKLTVTDSSGSEHGTLTLEDVSIDEWNAMDQESILMFNTSI